MGNVCIYDCSSRLPLIGSLRTVQNMDILPEPALQYTEYVGLQNKQRGQ
jgi:hypothetical protein